MARTIAFTRSNEVLHTISERVGGPRHGGNHPIDVMLIQYLLNRRDQNLPDKPYGAQRPLALDGVMGAQTHYRLLHFIVGSYGAELSTKPQPDKIATVILPIPNPTLEVGLTPQVVILAFPMALLSAQAYVRGPKPTASKVSLPDMPPALAEALEKNVTDFSSVFPKSVRSKV